MRRLLLIAFTFCSLALFACGDYPIFTEMATNRLKVVLKGTYESNDPADWQSVFSKDDSVDDNDTAVEFDPTEFMMDIAEMRLKASGDSDKFAFYRQTYSFLISDLEDYFNGTGVEFDCDDPYSGRNYVKLYVYIRKMIFNNASDYRLDYSTGNWITQDVPEVIFREEDVYGFDINQVQYTTYWDTLRIEGEDSIYIFPLVVEIPGGMVFDREDPETVLEVRFVIKNFLKRFELDYYSDGYYHVRHFWGLSDWLRDVSPDETVMGGNVQAVARAYVPGKTATITGTVTADRHVIAFEKGVNTIADFIVPSTPRPDALGQTCYQPKQPTLLDSNDIEAVLDYFVSYEYYKEGINSFIVTCLDVGTTYEEKWDEYYENVRAFKIPPLVTHSDGVGNFTLKNVPVGKTYLVFEADNVTVKSNLPDAFTPVGSGEVIIPETGADGTYSP